MANQKLETLLNVSMQATQEDRAKSPDLSAGVDEEAGEYWMWGTSDSILLGKFPATKGKFYKTIIAGHVGTGTRDLADDRNYHDVFYDGESHYYIDGSVYKGGKLLLLAYDEENGKYYQVENSKMIPVRPFDMYQ